MFKTSIAPVMPSRGRFAKSQCATRGATSWMTPCPSGVRLSYLLRRMWVRRLSRNPESGQGGGPSRATTRVSGDASGSSSACTRLSGTISRRPRHPTWPCAIAQWPGSRSSETFRGSRAVEVSHRLEFNRPLGKIEHTDRSPVAATRFAELGHGRLDLKFHTSSRDSRSACRARCAAALGSS